MAGEWTILIWALIVVIFLAKIPGISVFFFKLRKMSAFGIICTVLCLGYFADISYTKEGGTTNQSSSQTSESLSANSEAIVLSDTSSFIPQPSSFSSSSLPSFWHDDATDTDEDGIPDLWEKWTHGNRAIADGDIDRDEDGLTDLEEFQNQTDPRTADTDGDGFSDYFEVANGMNPVVSEDFTPVEPDTNNNGLPDIWDQAGFGSSFQDADHDDFDDYYETNYLPTASDSNFDVLVDVYSTRSVLLNWDDGSLEGSGNIIILPTTGTSVKIRLPFGADTEVKLLPAPYGTDPPSGELWKSRIGMTFAPRTGQNTAGTCIIASNGDISQKVVELESVITRFPDTEASMQMLSLGDDNNTPRIQVLEKHFEIIPDAEVYHSPNDVIGPFEIVNTVNIDPSNIHWSADYGAMSPSTGGSSSLTVTSIPPNDDPIVVTAEIALDDIFSATETAEVRRCPHHDFSLDSCTANFSPHLFETNWISVTLSGCSHHNDSGYLEIEVMRETTAGWQHIAYVDMDPSTTTVDRWGNAQQLPTGENSFPWDGIASENAVSAESPDVFMEGTASFRRALLQVIAGEPVPPPYYTLFVRFWNTDKSVLLDEVSRTVYVPQVVKIEMTDEAYEEFQAPILYPGTFYPHLLGDPDVVGCESNVVLYAGCADRSKAEVLAQIATFAQALYPGNVNVRFASGGVSGRYKTVHVLCDYSDDAPLGRSITYPVVFPNAVPFGTAYVNMNIVRMDSSDEKYYYENGPMSSTEAAACEVPSLFPFSPDNLAHAVASTAAHETGHLLGLVNEGHLGGTPKKHHNRNTVINGWMMNAGGYTPSVYHLGSHSNRMRTWKPINAQYLQFILPKGDQ